MPGNDNEPSYNAFIPSSSDGKLRDEWGQPVNVTDLVQSIKHIEELLEELVELEKKRV